MPYLDALPTMNLAARPVKTFLIRDTTRRARLLRVYVEGKCVADRTVHNAYFHVDDVDGPAFTCSDFPEEFEGDPRWPGHCDYCGFEFAQSPIPPTRMLAIDRIMRRPDTGQQAMLDRQWSRMAGAMVDLTWYHEFPQLCGPDGRSLMVICPDGSPWHIDGRASNCTLPNDQVHKCRVRHGDPDRLTVDKNGVTCSAGAGSIQAKYWHGFLRDGWLVDC